ncbi:DoxX family protein [Pyxidicoccus sp. 3LG]
MNRFESSPAVGATVLRVALGAVFLAHAWAKAFIFTCAGTARFFEAHGFPGWTAWPVFLAELLGGIALVAGFRTRWVALGLVPIMLGALKPHLANGWMFTSAGGGWEYVAFLILALVTQALMGSGAFAVDGARERRVASSGRAAGVVA